MTGALYVKHFLIPGFKHFDLDFCKAVVGNPDMIPDSNFTQDTQWLINQMIGVSNDSMTLMSRTEANDLVKETHKEVAKD